MSTAPADTPLDTFVWRSAMRWPLECGLAAWKSEVGLDHDEMRCWPGWPHPMTLVLLAPHFLVRLQARLDQREGALFRPRPDLLPQTTVYVGPATIPPPPHLPALLRYQRRHKLAASWSHRTRRLQRLAALRPP